jgi:hypothetical protein
MPYPTGVLQPPQCRFKALTPALARASTWVQTHASAEVRATGQVNISVMHFAEPSYPLVVDHDVTLTTTDALLDASHYVIDFTQASASAVVQLGRNAGLKGFTIQNLVAAATNADGVVTSSTCAAGGVATLATVRINGESSPYRLRNGVVVAGASGGSCDASLADVQVRSVSQAGLLVQSTATAATTTVADALFDGGSNGVRVTRGTVALDSVTISNSATQGVMVLPTGGDVVFTALDGEVTGSQREGLRIEAGTGATSASLLALTGTVVANNGANTMSATRYPGITLLARTARLLGVNVHDNAGGGLQASGAGTVITVDQDAGNAAHFDSNGDGTVNAYAGVRLEAGAALTATGMTANANDGQGVYVLGGTSSAALHGCQLDGNGLVGNLSGLRVDAGTVVVDGATVISNNKGAGIRQLGGAVTVSGTNLVPVVIRNNGAGTIDPGADVGIPQAAATFSATHAEFRENSGDGARVNNRDGAGVGRPVDFVNCLFIDNKNTGLRVQQSAPGSGSTRSLHVTSCTFQGGDRGVIIEPATVGATTWAVFQGNTVTKAANIGFILQGTSGSAISLIDNEIVDNTAPAPAPGEHAVGGLVLMGTPPGTFVMTGNRVHNNGYDQVAVYGVGVVPPSWSFGATSCAEANRIWCYNHADASVPWVGLIVNGATVTANYTSWTHQTPTSGVDYLLAGAGGLTVNNPCGTGLLCP